MSHFTVEETDRQGEGAVPGPRGVVTISYMPGVGPCPPCRGQQRRTETSVPVEQTGIPVPVQLGHPHPRAVARSDLPLNQPTPEPDSEHLAHQGWLGSPAAS